ncbi:MAG TPA: class A beta-lactamase, subclass A2 [Spirochaetota bacterium]|nr:class A beta-lactamase, subclass A2 [Spirochaetota bacterium]HQO23858.1 class A beta-lactamase, subclass A2 [Spirochaetota bacterium]
MKKSIITFMTKFFSFFFLLFFSSADGFANDDSLENRINSIISGKKASVGVAVAGIEDNFTFSINGKNRFPMMSVYKFHIVLAVLNKVDGGNLKLDQKIMLKKKDLHPGTWSPLRDKYPNGGVSIPLSEIIEYTITQSDNNGCDILIALSGGTETVKNFIDSKGINDFDIKATEKECHESWNVQYSNWSTPVSAAALLKMFYDRKIVSSASTEYLMNVMIRTSTGDKRIKGLIPPSADVAHKTGTSGTRNGITPGTNDIGIVRLPNGKHFTIAVFVSDSRENNAVNERIIAETTKAVWDYFVKMN